MMKKLTPVTFSSLSIKLFTTVHKPLIYAQQNRPRRVACIPFNLGLICRSRGYP